MPEAECTTADIAAAAANLRAVLRGQITVRLRDSARREVRRAVENILADPGLGWELIAPGHDDADPSRGLELDDKGRLERLVPNLSTPPAGRSPGTPPSPATTSPWTLSRGPR